MRLKFRNFTHVHRRRWSDAWTIAWGQCSIVDLLPPSLNPPCILLNYFDRLQFQFEGVYLSVKRDGGAAHFNFWPASPPLMSCTWRYFLKLRHEVSKTSREVSKLQTHNHCWRPEVKFRNFTTKFLKHHVKFLNFDVKFLNFDVKFQKLHVMFQKHHLKFKNFTWSF